jgi:hypothetical protein
MPTRRQNAWDTSSEDDTPPRRRRRVNAVSHEDASSCSECGLCDDDPSDLHDDVGAAESDSEFDENALEEHLLGMYACTSMSAKMFSLCVTSSVREVLRVQT